MKTILITTLLALGAGSVFAQQLPKNKITLSPYGVGVQHSFGYYSGAAYERYISNKNDFSLQVSFDYYKNFKSYEYASINNFGLSVMYHFKPMHKLEYSTGLGFEYGTGISDQTSFALNHMTEFFSDIKSNSIVLPQRLTWNINKRFFVALEARPMLSFVSSTKNGYSVEYQTEFRTTNFKLGAIHLGIKF